MPVKDADKPQPGEDLSTWLTRMNVDVQRSGESYEDWRDRCCQLHPDETPMRGLSWKKRHPAPSAGGGATGARGGAAKTLPAITGTAPAVVPEELPRFSANAVTAEMEVKTPGSLSKKRLRITYHLFSIPDVSHAELVKNVRLRTRRWVRRVYASANLAPKIMGISASALACPVANMLSITNWQGVYKDLPAGKDASNADSKLTLVLDGGSDVTIEVPLTTARTPKEIADAVKAAVERVTDPPAGGARIFNATLLPTPKVAEDSKTIEGCDIFFTKMSDGSPAPIKRVTDNDKSQLIAKLMIQAPGLNFDSGAAVLKAFASPAEALTGWDMSGNDGLPGGDPPQRRVLYSDRADVDDPSTASIHIYVVPKGQLAGRAYPGYAAGEITDPGYELSVRLKNAVIMSYVAPAEKVTVKPMDATDTSPFTLPHEICHVLAQTGHNNGEGDVMAGHMWPLTPTDSGESKGVPDTNGANAAKHIYGGNLCVGSESLKNNQTGAKDFRTNQDMMEDMHTRGAHLLGNW